MSKVLYVAFSDIQIEDWKRFSDNHSRLEHNGAILNKVRDLCIKYDCPALFCGDFFDDPKAIKNYVLQRTLEWLNAFKRKNIYIYAIDGNHDQSERNSITHRSPNYIRTLSEVYSNIIPIGGTTIVNKGIYVSGIPFLTDNKDFVEAVNQAAARVKKGPTTKHILLTHADLPGLKEPNGREFAHQNIPTTIYKIFEPFDLVLNGHIHRPQILYRKIVTLGATHQQRASDAGCEMGLSLVKLEKGQLVTEFIPLGLPEFKYIKQGKEAPKDGNFYIEIPKKIKMPEGTGETYSSAHKPTRLVKNYMKELGIKSKRKSDLLIKYLTNAAGD